MWPQRSGLQLHHADALRSATSAAASALGLAETTGTLVEGLSADLLVVAGDPIEDLEALCGPPLAVVCRGQPVTPCAGPEGQGGRIAIPRWTLRSAFGGGQTRQESPLGSSGRCPCVRACS